MTPKNQHEIDQNTLQVLGDAISLAIKENVGNKRFIDLERIPLICLSITNISKDIAEIKEMILNNRKESDIQHESFVKKGGEYTLIRSIVFGGVALVLMAVAKVALDSFIK